MTLPDVDAGSKIVPSNTSQLSHLAGLSSKPDLLPGTGNCGDGSHSSPQLADVSISECILHLHSHLETHVEEESGMPCWLIGGKLQVVWMAQVWSDMRIHLQVEQHFWSDC